jgi:hypothetical protein
MKLSPSATSNLHGYWWPILKIWHQISKWDPMGTDKKERTAKWHGYHNGTTVQQLTLHQYWILLYIFACLYKQMLKLRSDAITHQATQRSVITLWYPQWLSAKYNCFRYWGIYPTVFRKLERAMTSSVKAETPRTHLLSSTCLYNAVLRKHHKCWYVYVLEDCSYELCRKT